MIKKVDIIKDEIWISSIKNIKKGDELSYDYGYTFDKDDYKDHECKCGSKYCIGYIISSDEWDKFLRHLKNLKELVFIYEDRHDDIDLNNFFNFIKNNKVNLKIIFDANSKSKIEDIRLKYFDFLVLEKTWKKEKIKNCKFLSTKVFVDKGEQYLSESSANRLDKTNNFVYDDISSKELEYLYLYDE